MSCSACGSAIPPGSAACPNCGYPAEQSAAPEPDPGNPPVGPMPARSYNLDTLASALVVTLWITAATSLIGTLFWPILIIMALLFVPLIAMFLVWFYRARLNAGFLDWRQRWSPPWTVVGWLVPICFLWFPYQIMSDIWRAGQPPSERAGFHFLPAAWWACWCLGWFTGYRHVSTSSYGIVSSSTTLTFAGTVPSRVFAAAAAVFLALIVRRVSDGPVGGVGKLAASAGWRPGRPAPGPG